MPLAVESEAIRLDIIDGLRDMASNGIEPMEMVRFVQRELGLAEEMIISVLAYFCQAFCLPLPDVLPLREWIGEQDDKLIPVLRQRLMEWKFMKVQPFEDREVSRAEYEDIKSKTRVLEKYHATFRTVIEPSEKQVKLTGSVLFYDHVYWPSGQSEKECDALREFEWNEALTMLDKLGFVRTVAR